MIKELYTPQQMELRDRARDLAGTVMRPVAALHDAEQTYPWEVQKAIKAAGLSGVWIPKEYGGLGGGVLDLCIVVEEFSRACGGMGVGYAVNALGSFPIIISGTDEQKQRWLPAIATGEARASLALLDADLDWRPEAAATRAEKTATGFALTGTKRFVPWAHVANVLLVPAQAPEGLTLFCVDPAASGVTLAPAQTMDPGTRWSSVTLARAPVAADAVLGAPGQAGPLLAALLRRGAVAAAAEMLGAARRCLDLAVGYAKVREQFGQPIGSFQAIRHKCAEMLLEVENSHAAVYYAAWALDARADDHELAASVAKAYVGDAARRVCGEAIQVHGGIGFTWEYDLHIYFKRAKALEAQYGDGDYHRELIVRRVAA